MRQSNDAERELVNEEPTTAMNGEPQPHRDYCVKQEAIDEMHGNVKRLVDTVCGTIENPIGMAAQVAVNTGRLERLEAKLNNGLSADVTKLKDWRAEVEKSAEGRRRHYAIWESSISAVVVAAGFSLLMFVGKAYLDHKDAIAQQQRDALRQELQTMARQLREPKP